jgi:hypothetical protein
MFTNDRNKLREFYREAWRKQRENLPVEPLEAQVADIIVMHPEYHALLEGPADALDRDYTPDDGQENPFLHMGLHLALREQLATGRPPACHKTYQQLLRKIGDAHRVEHAMMECLGQVLYQAQTSNSAPDETAYETCLQALLSNKTTK